MPLRIEGTLPVTAQSPRATTTLLRARAVCASLRSSWLLTAPSMTATSTPSGHSWASTSGPKTMSAFAQHVDDRLVDVEQRHVAARAAVQPAGADLHLVHHRPSRIEVRPLTTARCLVISSTPQPFSAIAPGRAGLHALAAAGAGGGLTPGPLQLRDEMRADAAAGDVPHVRALDLGAGAHAARAQDAAVVVEHVARVRGVDGEAREAVGVADVRDAVLLRQRLQLAVAGRDAHGADVVALGEQQLEGDLAVGLELRRGGDDRLALLHGRGAGGQQARRRRRPRPCTAGTRRPG